MQDCSVFWLLIEGDVTLNLLSPTNSVKEAPIQIVKMQICAKAGSHRDYSFHRGHIYKAEQMF